MRVRILKYLAGPTRACSPGQVLELPDDEAQRYIGAGAAVSLEPPRVVPAVPEPAPIETATAEPEVETPEAPRPKRGRARA